MISNPYRLVFRLALPYGTAIASTAVALSLTLLLQPWLSQVVSPFFFVAVTLTTWQGGLWPGFVAIGLSTLAINLFLVPPLEHLSGVSVSDIVRFLSFSLVAIVIHGLSTNLKASQRQVNRLNQKLLEDSADRLKMTLQAAQMGLWDWNLVTGEIRWSPEHESLFGLAPGSFDGKYTTFLACLHPDDRDGLEQTVHHSLTHHQPYRHEFCVVWPDGSLHWIEGRGQAFYNAAGQPIQMTGTIMAIDERKQVQISLQHQFEQHRLVASMTNRIRQSLNLQAILQTTVDEVRQFLHVDRVVILQFDPDWVGTITVESVADETLSLLPLDIYDPCLGKTCVEPFKNGLVTAKADIYQAEILPCHVEFLAQFQIRANLVVPILKQGELWGLLAAHHCSAPRPWQDAEIDLLRQLTAQVSVALQKAGLFEQVQVELIERQQAEAALKEQDALLQLFAQYAPAGIAMFDRDMRYVMASQRWVEEYQLESVASVINRSHYDLFPEIPDRWRQIHQRCLAGAIEKCDEDCFVRADGTQQWISWEVRPWYTATGAIGGIIIFAVDITARKQAEEVLRQSETRLRLAQSASNSAVWDWDIPTNTLFWSPEYYQLYGLDPTMEPNYENWLRCIHPEDREQANQITLRALEDSSIELRAEFRITRAGEELWLAGIGQVFWDAEGSPLRVLGITIDITQQKQAELALQQFNFELEQRVRERTAELITLNHRLQESLSEQQQAKQAIENLYNKAPCGYHSLNAEGTIVQINDTELSWLGYSRDQVLHQTKFIDYLTPESQQIFLQNFPQFLQRGWVNDLEFQLRHRDGSTRWISVNGTAIKDAAGHFVMSRSSAFDISDRKRTEAILQQKTQMEQLRWQLTQAIRQSLDLTAILNTTAVQLRQTLQADRVAVYRFQPDWSGTFIAESVGEGWVRLVTDDVQPCWEDTYLQDTQGGRFQKHEPFMVADIYTAGLQACHIELLEQYQAKAYAVVPIFAGETLWGLLAIYQNSDARNWQDWEVELLQQIASQLAIAIQQADLYSQLQLELQERTKLDQIKQDFISVVSHELRTPLTSIRGALGMLAGGVYDQKPDKKKEMIAIAARQSDRLVRLVNDILDLRRLESGQTQFSYQSCMAAELIQQSVDVMRSQAEQHQITLSVLPTQSEVWVDADAIVQTLTNLLSNAIKFSPPNSTITITAAPHRPAPPSLIPLTLFSVEDQGRGIPADQLETIFGQFQQVDTSDSRDKGGTGLGLAICRTIVEQHGGSIWVSSVLGQGSTFYVTLPSTQISPHTKWSVQDG